MALREILEYPDERLRRKAKPVDRVDDEIRTLVDDMAETMYAAPGIGLAATQIGVEKRVTVIDINAGEEMPEFLVFINPRIIQRDGDIVWEEGCLSFPDIHVDVERSAFLKVVALDYQGKEFTLEANDLLAVAIQHEIDHLDGVTLADKVSFLRRKLILRELTKNRLASQS